MQTIVNKKSEREIENDKAQRVMNVVAKRAAFYRSNPQRYATEIMNVPLKLFQKILIYAMIHNYYFAYIASRSQGKTWLTALYACIRCILYPGTKICIAASTKKQGCEVLGKILEDFMKRSPILCQEIEKINTGVNDAYCYFKNSSWIKVVVSNDNSRGELLPSITKIKRVSYRLLERKIGGGLNVNTERVCIAYLCNA